MAYPSVPYTPFHDPRVVVSVFTKLALPFDEAVATKLIGAVRELPLNEAVTTAVLLAVTLPALAKKDPEDWPPEMMTEPGTVRLVLSSVTLTVVLLLTLALIVTVHKAEADELKLDGEQDSDDNVGVGGITATCTVPPVAVIGTAVPLAEVATGSVIWIVREVLVEPMLGIAATVASKPLLIGVVFNPQTTHFSCPGLLAHVIVLPAATKATLGIAVTEVNSEELYEKVNCRLTTEEVDVAYDRPTLTSTPAVVEPDPSNRL